MVRNKTGCTTTQVVWQAKKQADQAFGQELRCDNCPAMPKKKSVIDWPTDWPTDRQTFYLKIWKSEWQRVACMRLKIWHTQKKSQKGITAEKKKHGRMCVESNWSADSVWKPQEMDDRIATCNVCSWIGLMVALAFDRARKVILVIDATTSLCRL